MRPHRRADPSRLGDRWDVHHHGMTSVRWSTDPHITYSSFGGEIFKIALSAVLGYLVQKSCGAGWPKLWLRPSGARV